jgi:FkbH-like protein
MKIAVLSNVNQTQLVNALSKSHEVYQPDGHGAWVTELLATPAESALARSGATLIFIVLDGEELLQGYTDYKSKLEALDRAAACLTDCASRCPTLGFFVSNIDLPQRRIQPVRSQRDEYRLEAYWANAVSRACSDHNNIFPVDLKNLVSEIGRKSFYSEKLWYLAGAKYSISGSNALSQLIERLVASYAGARKKAIVLDCDNTLWGGVLGEDGLEGIELSNAKEGARYKDFQRRLKELKESGVLLAVASKNNAMDVLEALERHPDMVLKPADFALMEVHWESKSGSLLRIAEKLNIGVDSIVFVDDSPIERGQVKTNVPEVVIAPFPTDSAQLPRLATQLFEDHFFALDCTLEDQKKTRMYLEGAQRETARTTAPSLDEFLRDLETKLRIGVLRQPDVARAAQLTQKTNQFNVTTRRYTEADILQMTQSAEKTLLLGAVSDRFGDSGKTVLVILSKVSETHYHIDTFLMSCRVMGRRIEDAVMQYIAKSLAARGATQLTARFVPTKKNQVVESLFEKLGFALTETDDDLTKHYKADISTVERCQQPTFCIIEDADQEST